MIRSRLAPVLLTVFLSGCINLDPHFHRPDPAVPTTWPGGPAYATATATPADQTAADLGWRDVIVDTKLRTIIESALKNNRDLRIAVLNVQAARGQFETQRAALFPTINGSANLVRQHEPTSALGFKIPGSSSVDVRYYGVTASVTSYQLDLFGQVRSLTRAAFEQYLATDEARRAAQITLIAEVATADVTLAADRERLKVAQQTLASQQASLKLTQARFSAGEASELDVRQAETTVDQARSDIATYTTQSAQDLNALNLLVGAPVPEALLPTGIEGEAPLTPDLPAGVSSDVLLKRPDVLQAERQLRAYNADVGAARAAFFPTLSLTGSGGSESPGLSGLFSAGSGVWSFTPSLAAPIFDWGANRGRLKTFQAQRKIAVEQYQKAVQTAFREVADALARRGTIAEQLAANQANVDAASTTLRLTQARYDRGVDPYLNILVAQRTLYAAQQKLVTARLALYSNGVALYQALGGGVR